MNAGAAFLEFLRLSQRPDISKLLKLRGALTDPKAQKARALLTQYIAAIHKNQPYDAEKVEIAFADWVNSS